MNRRFERVGPESPHSDRSPSGFLQQVFNVAKNTRVANLNQGEVIKDEVPANGCVRVMTIKGGIGTLSHLNISHDPARFAADLKKVAGTGAAAILNGGESDSRLSASLLGGIHRGLRKEGFVVANLEDEAHNDVGGYFGRVATLHQDGADVIRKGAGQPEKITLKFPR